MRVRPWVFHDDVVVRRAKLRQTETNAVGGFLENEVGLGSGCGSERMFKALYMPITRQSAVKESE